MTDTAARLSKALDGRYRIVREVGAGGMATVYLAEDLRHHREVALKVLRPELAATMGPERFFREIQVAARLQHPHILPLHDSGEADGFLFYVMPFVAGESLRTRVDRIGELPIADAVRILSQVADALSYSHSQGVVHRDIKPDNVMLSGRHALVTDFGVAKAVREAAGESRVTTAGVALGTPAYMAPEQAAADPQLDHRVDLYALGVLGYELIAGRTPFHGLSPQQQLMAHVTQPPDPLRKWRDACPAELEAIVMRCLAKKAADRFQSADEVLHALEPLAGSSGGITPTQTRPMLSTSNEAIAPAKKRSPALVIGPFVAIFASLIAVLISTGNDNVRSFERVRLTASGSTFSASLSPDGTRLALAERRCVTEDACLADLRVQDMGGAGASTIVSGITGIGFTDWSSDGRWIVFVGSLTDRYGVWAVPALGGAPKFLGCCAASFGQGDTVVIASAPSETSGQEIRRLTLPEGRIVGTTPLPGWKEIVISAWQVPGTDRLLLASTGSNNATTLQLIDRDGTVLDSLTPPASLRVHQLRMQERGFLLGVPDPDAGTIDLVRFSLDDDRITRERRPVARAATTAHASQVTRDGRLIVADGPIEYAVWALERTSLSSTRFSQRLVERSTAPITGAIAPSGEWLLINRARPSDLRVSELSVIPFRGGASVSLGTERDVVDWDWRQDSRSILIVRTLAGDSIAVVDIDAATGLQRAIATFTTSHRNFETVMGGGYVHNLGLNEFVLRGLRERNDTTFTGPADLEAVQFIEPSPDGTRAASIGWSVTGDSILIHVISFADGSISGRRALYGEGFGAITWLPDDSMIFPVNRTAWNQVWYRLSATGAATPLAFRLSADASYRFSRSGLRAVGRERIEKSDVFLLTPSK